MTRLPIVLALMVGAGAAMAADGRQVAFRSAVDMVPVSVTVTGPDGRFVPGLTAADFTVFEDGIPQQILVFERATNPLIVSLLLDSSSSMTEQLSHAQQAAIDFISRLRGPDSAEIIDFDSRVRVLQPFTSDHQALEKAIRSTTSGGSTSLYEAIFVALGLLESERARWTGPERREVLLVLSDGADNSPRVRFDPLLEMVKKAPASIYTIGLGLDELPSNRIFGRWAADSEANLRSLARETGGRLLVANEATDLSGVYNEIAEELNNQYLLGYASRDPERLGWRTLSVRTEKPGIQVRTRTGVAYTAR